MYILRAATTALRNSEAEIQAAVEELWSLFVKVNDFAPSDIMGVLVSATDDLDAAYPASFIRAQGYPDAALIDLCQLKVTGGLSKCIRLLIFSGKNGQNLYLREAAKLRPEWGLNKISIKDAPVPRAALTKVKPYVPGKPIDEVKREYGLSDVIKLASNENPYGPSQKAVATMIKKAAEVNLYPDGSGHELKKVLADFYDLRAENFLIGNGSDEIIKMLSETYLNPGDNIVTADITFSEYEFGALLMGADVKKVPLKDFTHDLDGFLDAMDDKTKICYICNPNNPTGTMISHDNLGRFLEALPEHVVVVLDEAYAEYADRPEYPDFKQYIHRYPLVVLRTFSKIYGLAGLRIGICIADTEILNAVEKTREPFNVNLIGQAAAISALEDQEYREYCFKMNLDLKNEFYKMCQKRDISYIESVANFVLIEIPDARVAVQRLLEKGIIVRWGKSFGLEDHIRVTLGTKSQMQLFWDTFDKVRGN